MHKAHQIVLLSFFIFSLVSLLSSGCKTEPVEPTCDTSQVTYSGVVSPIISTNCTSCHSGDQPAGGIPLTNYNEIANATANGRLLGTINHESGYSPMPKNADKLSDCEIQQIEAWNNNGTPNN